MKKGAILIFVLWLLFVISALVIEVSFRSGIERSIARGLGDKIYFYPLALSLLDAGIYRYAKNGTDSSEFKVGGRTWIVDIKSESGKIDVNKLNRDSLEKLLDICGVEIGEERSTIIDSFLDWIDKDSDRRLNGAEDDYYEELSPPYEARDGRILSLDELLLIRGFTPELFQCLSRFLTVYGSGGKIDINSASKEELKALGLSDDEIDAIMEAREEERITKEKLEEIIPDLEDKDWYGLITFSPGKIYRVRIRMKRRRLPEYQFIVEISGSKYRILEALW